MRTVDPEDEKRLSDLLVYSSVLLAILQDECDEMAEICGKYGKFQFGTKRMLNDATKAYDRFWVCLKEMVIREKMATFNEQYTSDYEALKSVVEEYIAAEPDDVHDINITAPQYIYVTDFGSVDGIVKGTRNNGGIYTIKYEKCK